jgi:rubredoxin
MVGILAACSSETENRSLVNAIGNGLFMSTPERFPDLLPWLLPGYFSEKLLGLFPGRISVRISWAYFQGFPWALLHGTSRIFPAEDVRGTTRNTKPICIICGWIYDEEKGAPGPRPGARWTTFPITAPDCGASKQDFDLIDL